MALQNYIRNSETEDLLRCMPVELLRMQRALRKELRETYVGGKPLIGELYTKIDKDRSIRDAVWVRIAHSDRFFEAMLTGARWGDDIPLDFDRRLSNAKHEMERRINGPYRQRVKKASMRPNPLPIRRSTRRVSRTLEEDNSVEGPASGEPDRGAQDLIQTIEELSVPKTDLADLTVPEGSIQPINIDIDVAAAHGPDPPEARPSLSATIHDAIDVAIADLKAKIIDLEEREAAKGQERDRHDTELEERLVARMDAALAERDVEIKTLKRELAAEKSWRLM